jgi:signal transduction histidine kinase
MAGFLLVGSAAGSVAEALRSIPSETAPSPLQSRSPRISVYGDPGLVEIVIDNALRNAIEASLAVDGRQDVPEIVISWGKTERDYWCSILDKGIGLPAAAKRLVAAGTTTKARHPGFGLFLAKRAALSLGGKMRLAPRQDGGTRFEFRWPAPNGGAAR